MLLHRLPALAVRAVAALLCATAGAASAATLEISVFDKDGQPVPDTAVLLRYSPQLPDVPMAPQATVIEQERLHFKPFLTIVPPGTTLRFVNRDAFDHHIRSTGPDGAKDFELRIGPAGGKPGEAKVDQLGRWALGCHLHSQMRGYVLVTDAPWYGKTNAEGKLTLNDLPEGTADVVLTHPEEYLEQPPQHVTLGAAPVRMQGHLNFTPRKRRW